jgi:hypothetical protein
MGEPAWWYVWPAGAWRGVDRMRRMEETKNYVVTMRGGVDGGRLERQRVEFPKGWFWGLFLLGAVFLWVERKMGGMNG